MPSVEQARKVANQSQNLPLAPIGRVRTEAIRTEIAAAPERTNTEKTMVAEAQIGAVHASKIAPILTPMQNQDQATATIS